MGYYVAVDSQDFAIIKQQQPAALEAVKRVKSYWVENEKIQEAETLEDALREWNFTVSTDSQGSIVEFDTESQKWGQQGLLFRALAPYVQDNSYLEFVGEDHERWRYLFCNGKLFIEEGQLSWSEPRLISES